jgi:hypothetical protein
MNNKNDLLKELIKNQRKNIKVNNKLSLSDMNRISNNLENSILCQNECSIWKGYITNNNSSNRSKYINFYFNHKKTALHRLLYINYVDKLEKNEYIKYSCNNKGICCNINHLKKSKKNNIKKIKKNYIKKNKKNDDNNDDNNEIISNNIVSFD